LLNISYTLGNVLRYFGHVSLFFFSYMFVNPRTRSEANSSGEKNVISGDVVRNR